MDISVLNSRGVERDLIEIWQEAGITKLLPVQKKAVLEHGLLDGRNIVVSAPTSSGKTFIGEMAALRMALHRRTFYLVPQKALAEEKYEEFCSRYQKLGVRVVISSRDRKEFEEQISLRQFDLAIVVFEKMQSLLVSDPTLLRDAGLVVIDELQMMGDEERGPNLELLLTKILHSPERPQVIGLSAVLDSGEDIARWMNAEFCRITRRPVELRKGILLDGTFRYIEHNSKKEGSVNMAPVSTGMDAYDIIVRQARIFARAGEQSLVFLRSKKNSIKMANRMAKYPLSPLNEGMLQELSIIEESSLKSQLRNCLKSGVAFHNADLDRPLRTFVEKHFKNGNIKVLCSTTTLAMGLNLPAQNVLIDPVKYVLDRKLKRWFPRNLAAGEFENIGGRAGRLGLNRYGNAILVATSKFEAKRFYLNIIKGELEGIKPSLSNNGLEGHVLNLIASGICSTIQELEQTLIWSFTGMLYWRGNGRETIFKKKLHYAVKRCLDGGLINVDHQSFVPTDIGYAAAVHGISINSAIGLEDIATANTEVAQSVSTLEILLWLCQCEDGSRMPVSLSKKEISRKNYLQMLQGLYDVINPESARRINQRYPVRRLLTYNDHKAIKKAMLLCGWMRGEDIRSLETKYSTYSGAIVNLAQQVSWLADVFCEITDICDWNQELISDKMKKLSRRLFYGLPEKCIPLTPLTTVKGLGRIRIQALVNAGFDSIEKIAQVESFDLERFLTRPLAENLVAFTRDFVGDGFSNTKKVTIDKGTSIGRSEKVPPKIKDYTVSHPIEPSPSPMISEQDENYGQQVNSGSIQNEVRLELVGTIWKNRFLVKLNGSNLWFTGANFINLLKFAAQRCLYSPGWVDAASLTSSGNYHQVIRRLRKSFSKDYARLLIEGDGARRYRLTVNPQQIIFHTETILSSLNQTGIKHLISEVMAKMSA